MSTATLAGIRATHARAFLPAWGVPWAEVSLEEERTLSGSVELAIADFKMSATIMSGGPGPKGRSSFRLAAGAGGWGKKIGPKGYANDAGVKVATVVTDAARACGETLDDATIPKSTLGPAFTRDEGPAARVLEHVAASAWHVGEDGKTRIGKRASAELGTAHDVISLDRARGTVVLAADAIASIVPGVVVDGLEAVDVVHEVTPEGFRSTLWAKGQAETSRRLTAWRRIADQLDPDRRFRGVYEYRVITQDGERLNLQPIRTSIGMPVLERVFVRPGIAGARVKVALGARVLVGFVNAERARPVVLAFEDAEGDGFVPLELDLDASTVIKLAGGTLGVARLGDTVQAGPFTGTITSASLKVRAG